MFHGSFFRGKKVLVTGHTGFKGTWLSLMLESMGSKIYGYALEHSEETEFYKESGVAITESCGGYIQDRRRLSEYVMKIRPEIVIHLASHSTLNKSAEITDYIFDSNVMGVVNLLESVREVGTVRAVLVVTSDKCYENTENEMAYDENARLGAQDPYSTSKACQELITQCYRKSFFGSIDLNIPIATARASNVIGGGDNNITRLFPYLLECFSKGVTAEIRKPEAVRPWQNVLDVLGGYLTLVQKMTENGSGDSLYCSAFNFGPEPDGFVTVRQAADVMCGEFEKAEYIVSGDLKNVIETNVLKLDSSKAKNLLDWHPIYNFNDTVKLACDFKKRTINNENIGIIARDFIGKYMKGIGNA